jgi:hypothetical protein
MSDYTYEREARTGTSEAYSIEVEGEAVGRVDLHYTPSTVVYATLCVPSAFDEDDIEDLIGDIDERLVLSHDPDRVDFVVAVWRGDVAGVYSEDLGLDEDEDEDEEDEDDDAEEEEEN